MSRTETSNTWEEGLIMDLNPLSTPNTVLTDCVNGTFITYNGNEFSLQNDQGNYKLEYCRLTPNYIPVGIKEYGDILYIVSQNPLDNSVEIGSYPSPLMITVPDEKENNNEFNSIIKTQILDKDLTEGTYTELMENTNSIIFNGDDYKLNPGDEYCLQTEGDKPPYKYETIEYHILDEDSNVYDVTDKIIIDDNGNPKDFQHVAWTVPGWLSIKARLAELSVAGINIRSFYVPKNNNKKTAHFAFNLRLNVNDTYLTKKINGESILNNWCSSISEQNLSDVRFRLFIETEQDGVFKSIYKKEYVEFGITDTSDSDNIPDNLFLNECDWTEWYGDSRILWRNISGKITNLNGDEKVRVRMIPVLYEEEYKYKIVYDNLEQSLIFDLTSVEDEEWDLGEDLYQFYLNPDKSEQYIYTNVTGPMISSFPVNLYGTVYDLNGNEVKTITFESYTGIGENILQIPFDENFKTENIYVIQFKFAPSLDEIGNFPIVTRFLITSEIFNDFSDVLVYDRDIKFDEWIKRYWSKNKTQISINYKDVNPEVKQSRFHSVLYERNGVTSSTPTSSDRTYMANKEFNTFLPSMNSGLSDVIKYRKGYNYTFEYNTEINEQFLEGDLWSAFAPKNDLKRLDYSTNTLVDFDLWSKSDQTMEYNKIPIASYLELLCKYQSMGVPFDFCNSTIWRFNESLSELNKSNSDLKLENYIYDINFNVYGRKEEDEEGDNKSISVSGKLYVNGVIDTKDDVSFYERFAGTASALGSDNKHKYWVYPKINNALIKYNLPCMLVKATYCLAGPSVNFKLYQTICGGPHGIYDYTFSHDGDVTIVLYFIAFREQSSIVPVLIPLGIDGNSYFKTFCKKMYLVQSTSNHIQADRYILTEDSLQQYNPRITIYNAGHFTNPNLTYCNSNFKTTNDRLTLISKINSWFTPSVTQLKYSNIITDVDNLDSAINDDKFVVFDETVASVEFDFDKFPYEDFGAMDGINSIRQNLVRWASHSDKDFDTWNNSIFSEDPKASGLYCDGLPRSSDAFLMELNAGYSKTDCVIKLVGKSYNYRDGITPDVLKHKFQDVGSVGSVLRNKAMWMTYHNSSAGAVDVNQSAFLGGCLSSNPTLKLDEGEWGILLHEV